MRVHRLGGTSYMYKIQPQDYLVCNSTEAPRQILAVRKISLRKYLLVTQFEGFEVILLQRVAGFYLDGTAQVAHPLYYDQRHYD